jgi:hypothetical protein
MAALQVRVQELEEYMRQQRQDLRDLQQKVTSLEVRLEAVRADLLKWMFIFWLGNLGGIGAILFVLARYILLR